VAVVAAAAPEDRAAQARAARAAGPAVPRALGRPALPRVLGRQELQMRLAVRQAPGWPALPQALGRQELQTRQAVHRPAWAIPVMRPRPHVARRLPGRTLPERPNRRVAARRDRPPSGGQEIRQEGPAADGSTELRHPVRRCRETPKSARRTLKILTSIERSRASAKAASSLIRTPGFPASNRGRPHSEVRGRASKA
jgi:hypothetical protein